ncbi:unnamed protein product, partial [Rotaria sp. Silwood1]
NFVGAVNIYLYIIGAVRSFSLVRLGYTQFILRIIGTLATIPFVVDVQGILLVVHDIRLPLRVRLGLGIALYSWVTLPITSLNVILAPLCPIPLHWTLNFLINFVGAVNIYLYIIGAVRSFSLVRLGYAQFILRIIGTLATIPFVV